LAIIVAIVLTMSWLTPHAALLGPGTAGAPATAQLVRNATNGSASRITWNASAIGSNVRWLFTSNLPAIFGWQPAPLERYVTSTISSGHVWALVALVALAGLASTTWIRWRIGRVSVTPGDPADARQAGARNGRRSAPDPLIPGPSFVIYLILVGLMAILAYVTVSRYVQDHMLIRYTLLALLTPIGITAWLFRVEQARWIQGAAAASILAWSLAAGTDDARLLAEYVRNPPPDEYRQLNVFLWDQGVRYGKAPYWTAYMIDFLSNERIVLNSSDVVRVLEYRNIVNQHLDDAFTVSNGPCVSPEAIAFQRWCLAPMAK
jgi:hypothetical protein